MYDVTWSDDSIIKLIHYQAQLKIDYRSSTVQFKALTCIVSTGHWRRAKIALNYYNNFKRIYQQDPGPDSWLLVLDQDIEKIEWDFNKLLHINNILIYYLYFIIYLLLFIIMDYGRRRTMIMEDD